jgi:MYXO-CTERM domain-containing protein
MTKPCPPSAGNDRGPRVWSLARRVTLMITASLLLVFGLLSLGQPVTGHASPIDAAGMVATLLLLALTSRRRRRYRGRHRRSTMDGAR